MHGATLVLSLIVLVLLPFGCPEAPEPEPEPVEEPAAPAEREVPGEGEAPVPGPGPAPASASARELHADVARSKVGFSVARATVGHVGHFEQFAASLGLDEQGQPVKLDIRVQTGSVVADRKGLTTHLRSADFFDVDRFPTATFTTEAIVPDLDEGADAYTVRGTMRLHGVEQKLEFGATITLGEGQAQGRATLDISAKAFGITYAGMEAELAEDAVALEVELWFVAAQAPSGG